MQSLTSLCVNAIFKQGGCLPKLSFPNSVLNKYEVIKRYDEMHNLIKQRTNYKLEELIKFINKKAQMMQLMEFDVFSQYEMLKYNVVFTFNRPLFMQDIPNGTFLIYYEIKLDCFGMRAKKDDMCQAFVYCENKWHCTGGLGNWFPIM